MKAAIGEGPNLDGRGVAIFTYFRHKSQESYKRWEPNRKWT